MAVDDFNTLDLNDLVIGEQKIPDNKQGDGTPVNTDTNLEGSPSSSDPLNANADSAGAADGNEGGNADGSSQADGASAAGENSSGEEGNQSNVDNPPVGTPDINESLIDMTGGQINSGEQLSEVLTHYSELLEIVNDPSKLFESDPQRAKFFDFYNRIGNSDPAQAGIKYFQVMGLDTNKMSDKDALFQAFTLNPENNDLSPGDLKTYFDADFESEYGNDTDLEELKTENPLLHRKLTVAARKAKEEILSLQESLNVNSDTQQADTTNAEDDEAYTASINKALGEFTGLDFKFSEEQKDDVKFVLSPEQKQQFKRDMLDPSRWWGDVIESFVDEKGTFNAESFRDTMLITMFPKEFARISYQQGIEHSKINNQTELRNSSGGTGNLGGSRGNAEESFVDAWSNATKG